MIEWVYPSQIRFNHNTIGCTFKSGSYVNDVAEDLCIGDVGVDDIRTIEIVIINGKRYTFHNRRLYVFRVAQLRGEIAQIPVKIVPVRRFIWSKFTTKNDGRTVRVRGDKTMRHCMPQWLRNDGISSDRTRTILKPPTYLPSCVSVVSQDSGFTDMMSAFPKMKISQAAYPNYEFGPEYDEEYDDEYEYDGYDSGYYYDY